MDKPKELSRECKVGEVVKWSQINGESFSGTLIEWDNGTAIINTEKGVKAVCA